MNFARMLVSAMLLTLVAATAATAAGDEIGSSLSDQKSVAVTIYNENLALVKDVRGVVLPKGASRVAFRDVSGRIDPTTALVRSLSRPNGVAVREQNFNYDLLSPQKLLEKYVGRIVTVVHTNPATGEQTRERAKVLSTNEGIVLQYGNRIETGIDGRLAFDSIPVNLRDRPTLVTELNSAAAGRQTVELSYLTGGLSWRADYVGELSAQEDRLDLNGLVTLSNNSGTTYGNAKLQLVAGDVNRARQELEARAKAVGGVPLPAPTAFVSESLFEYHLYTLTRPTNIADRQTKQVALLTANGIPVEKSLELRGFPYYYVSASGDLGQKLKVSVYVQFANEGGGLGIALPKGIVRIYKRDSSGNAQFVGEDWIDHTPRTENVRLHLGESFDVTASKKQTDYTVLPQTGRPRTIESAYQIELKNAKNEAVTVKVVEPVPGDWQILSENYPHEKTSSATVTWNIRVPANGSATLTYRVRVRV